MCSDIGDIRQQQPGQQQQDGGEGERRGPLVALGKDHQRMGHVVKEEGSANKGRNKINSQPVKAVLPHPVYARVLSIALRFGNPYVGS